uniref:CCHC-type domain-containing protein n=1 Tax=Romanomermis culicivorax TaxID=13658 RepID=A0A915J3I7_ROMCU
MSNQRSNAQCPSAMPSDKIERLQSEMARLTAHIVRLTAQQMTPAPRNLTPPTQQSAHIQNAGDHPSGAHLQMCSYHGRCSHNDTSCQAQHPNSTGPSNATATNTGRCYFCRMRGHPTDRCNGPCPHCHQIRVHRAMACPHRIPTVPATAVVSALGLTPALPPPLKYATPITLNPSMMPKLTGDFSIVTSY